MKSISHWKRNDKILNNRKFNNPLVTNEYFKSPKSNIPDILSEFTDDKMWIDN